MNIICDRCNYTAETKEFKPLTINKFEDEVVDGKLTKVKYSKTDYMCPKCLRTSYGKYEPNGYN